MKIFKLTALIFTFFLPLIMNGQNLSKDLGLKTEVGEVNNEAYVKFNFQDHKLRQRTQYNIAFFERAENLEFWGHGRKVFSILGPVQIDLYGEDIRIFYTLIRDHFEYFQKNIRGKVLAYEHTDLVLFEAQNIVFSCYMNRLTPEYAFWVGNEKYSISDKSILSLLSSIQIYFSL